MRKLLPLILFVLICTAAPSGAQAQFWKKLFKKEAGRDADNKAKEKEADRREAATAEKEKQSRDLPAFPETVKKERYRIDVLIPMYLQSLITADNKPVHKRPPPRLAGEVNFYEGLRMAADTLGKSGLNLDIYIHDVTDPAHSIDALTHNAAFAETDLIIGFLTSSYLEKIIPYTKSRKINFISALSPADLSTREHPCFVLIQPTLETHIDKLVTTAARKFARQPKFIFYKEDKGVQREALDALTGSLERNGVPEDAYERINCTESVPSKDSLMQLFDRQEVNLVFLNVLSQTEALPILQTLSDLGPGYRFAVFGMPSWKGMEQLSEPASLPGLSVYITNPFYYELTSTRGRAFAKWYEERHGLADPSEMVFRGYETLVWMANLLSRYGTVFNPKITDSQEAPFTPYKVLPKWDAKNNFLYFENRHLYIYQYTDGVMTVD